MASPYTDASGCQALVDYLDRVQPKAVVILAYGSGYRAAQAWAWQRRVPFRIARPLWDQEGRPAAVRMAERLATALPRTVAAWDRASAETGAAVRAAFAAGNEIHLLTVGSTRTTTRTIR